MKKLLLLCSLALSGWAYAAEIAAFYATGATGVFHTGMTAEVALALKNPGNGTVKVFNRAGKLVDEKKITLSDGGTMQVPLKKFPSGFYRCTAEFGGKTAECSFIFTEPMARRDPFFATWASFNPKESLEAYVRMGFGGLRLTNGFPYFDLTKYPDDAKLKEEIEKSPYTTRLQDVLKRYDFHYVFALQNEIGAKDGAKVGPGFARDRAAGYYPYSERLARRFAVKLNVIAEKFGDKVNDWMFVSEVDSAIGRERNLARTATFEMAHYVTGARLAWNILKKRNPSIRFGLLPTCGHDYFRDTPKFWLTKMMMGDMEGKFDYNALDAYNGNYNLRNGPIARPEDGLRQYLLDTRALNREYGKDGVVTVEERQIIPPAHYPLQGKTAELLENHTIRECIIIKSVRGCRRYALLDYAWKADMTLFKYLEDAKGGHVRNPFPAAMGLSTIMRFLCMAEPMRKPELILPHEMYVYFFRRDGKKLVCFWTAGTREFDFETRFNASYAVTDFDGNTKRRPAGKARFHITNAPVLLTCDEKSPRAIFESGTIVNMPDLKGEARLLDRNNAALLLANQLNKPLAIRCGGRNIELRGGERKTIKLPAFSKPLSISANGRNYSIAAPAAATPVFKIPAASVDGDLAKYAKIAPRLLKFPDDLYPKSALIPERALILHDGKDLEVTLYLAWDASFLRIAAKVRDRIHINNFQAADLWRGDGLQLGIFPANDAWSAEITGRKSVLPFNLSAALTDSGVRLYDYAHGKTPDWPCSIKRQGLYTTYELAIPWSALGIVKPVSGTVFALNAVVFDYIDPAKGRAQHWAALAPGLAEKLEPSQFKTFILE